MRDVFSPGVIDRILTYIQAHQENELLIQLDQDFAPGQETGFRFWLHIWDGQVFLRMLMAPALHTIVPRNAGDCCPWRRVNKTKWRRDTGARNLIKTWQAYAAEPALTQIPVTDILKESDQTRLFRQFVPDDPAHAPRWVAKYLTDLFGQTVGELRQYSYELIPDTHLLRIRYDVDVTRNAASSSESPVSGFLAASLDV